MAVAGKPPVVKNNLITPAGYKKLVDEADDLWKVQRPIIVEEVHQAALQGDRSENAEYIYGKKKLREIDKRLGFLGRRLDAAKIIDPTRQTGDKILFGATVSVADGEGRNKTYHIVGEDEADPNTQKISWKSPVGQALLNKSVGDFVEIETPRGMIELEVLGLKFPSA